MDYPNKTKNKIEENNYIDEKNSENKHKSIFAIKKEKEINSNIKNFSSSLLNIFIEISNVTHEYCTKVNKIIEKINNNYNYIDKCPEIKMQNLCKILKGFVKIIIKFFVNTKGDYFNKDDYYTNIEQNLLQLEEKFLLDIEKMEYYKNVYHQEFNNFEMSLIKDELFPKEKEDEKEEENIIINENENNDENDYIKRITEYQNAYLNINNKLKSELKEMFELINIKRNILLKIINGNFNIFLTGVYNVGKRLNKRIDEENPFILNIHKEKYLKEIEERVNNIFNEDIYEFKFLSKINAIKDGIKNIRKNTEDLLEKLNEENLENITKRLEKYKLLLSKENKQQIELVKTNKIIKYIITLIIDTPEKFSQEEKENLLTILNSYTDNQFLFLQYLNNYRTKGKLNFTLQSIKIFCEIFTYIFNLGLEKKIFLIIQLCIILSQTYYHENNNQSEKKNKNKIYIIHYLKNMKIFKDKTFWKNYLEGMIEEEKKRLNLNNNDNYNKIQEKKVSMILYASIFTLTKNMVDFGLDMDFIVSIVNKSFVIYNIPENQQKDIINYLIIELQQPKIK